MRQRAGAIFPEPDPSGRRAAQRADEARLGRLLERTYAAREARLTLADDALAKLNATLDAIGTLPQRPTDHRRLFGACALVALLLLLLSPVARFEFAVSTRNTGQSAVTSSNAAVGGGVSTGTASGRVAIPPVTVAAREAGSVAPTEGGGNATGHALARNGATLTVGTSETPLRDLLARAGIHAADPPGAPTTEGQPPMH